MEINPENQNKTLEIDSFELLIRFLQKCKNTIEIDEPRAHFISACADIVTAIYYYRKYPYVNDFIEKHLKDKENYFQVQWARSTWRKLSKMTTAEMCELVIKQVQMIDNSDQDE